MGTIGYRPALAGLLACLASCFVAERGRAQVVEWIRQVGTGFGDAGYGVSADGLGNVYISGATDGALGGPNAGLSDAFVSKYDTAGALVWTRQLGAISIDASYGASADGLGNDYISGETYGDLGGPRVGTNDAFVSKYDGDGALVWTRQLGTSSSDFSFGASADGLGNVYISGATQGALGGPNEGSFDAFVSKYDMAGALLWTRQLGTSNDDRSYGVSADGLGNVYIAGSTSGALDGPTAGYIDAFVSKYDGTGALIWTRQFGTSSDDASRAVSADGLGNVYVTGYTLGNLGGPNVGSSDVFVSMYDWSGELVWTRQLGTSSSDYSNGVSADGLGNIYLSGSTSGALGGPNAGVGDAFVSKYDAAGALVWTRQLGTGDYDYGFGVSTDELGNAYISGGTHGLLGGSNVGGSDAFLVKIAVPEPAAGTLMAVFGLTLTAVRRRTPKAFDRRA